MKLFKDDDPYISKKKWRQIFLAASIMTLALYVIAMICSLCGSDIFILKYQNEQMDKIQEFLLKYDLFQLTNAAFLTLNFFICLSFILNKRAPFYYLIAFASTILLMYYAFKIKGTIYTIIGFIFFVIIPAIDLLIHKSFKLKTYLFYLLKVIIVFAVTMLLEFMITVIKAGYFDGVYHQLTLSANFCYELENDITLSVLLFTIALYINREKGDSKLWTESHHLGGSSQTSKTQLPKSNAKKNLTKTQKNKIRWFYIKLYCIQLGTFLLVMVLPFLLGKVFEFLVMYLAFCVTRSILGFKYSLHYKKESLCATVGVIVFGILSLVVPFFYVVLIIAISLGVGLAVLLHLSYKYKGFYLFTKRAKPDKFAEISVIFDDDLSPNHVRAICLHRGLTKDEAQLMVDFAQGNKKSYLAYKYKYSEKTIERAINDCIDKLKKKD